MSARSNVIDAVGPTGSPTPTWWVICSRELRDLWVGGKALHMVLIYTVLLGLYSFVLASNAEVNLLPLKDMMLEMAKTSTNVSLLMSMIICADTITGERERATLEALLLTPASRRQLVLGKYLAAVSLCLVTVAITVPYLVALSKGGPILGPSIRLVVIVGLTLVPAFAGLGMLASVWSNTTKSSMLVTLGIYLMMLLPAEIIRPTKIMTTHEMAKAIMLQAINPLDSITGFMSRTLVYSEPFRQTGWRLILPTLFGLSVLVLLFGVASARLHLEVSTARRLRQLWQRLVPAKTPARAAARS